MTVRMAITHDYLDQYGGAERTVLAMCERLRSAPLYTSVYDRGVMRRLGFSEPQQPIVVSFMQDMPLRQRLPRYYHTWLYPLAFRRFDLRGYDLVLSSAHFAAKDLVLSPHAVHVSYCYTPPRFLWGFDSDAACRSMPLHERPLAMLAKAALRRLDYGAAQRVNLFVACSEAVARRVQHAYQRRAFVVYPPVDTARFGAHPPLVVVGTGPWEKRLRARAGPTVQVMGHLRDSQVERLMCACHAFVLPGEEDFGIAAVEAMAAGKPVLALRRGGATETVVDGETGLLYDEPTVESFLDALSRLMLVDYQADVARSRASLFDKAHFAERLDAAIAQAIGRGAAVLH
jgi:glycosyltransferase involved in cell wall biosynthesis